MVDTHAFRSNIDTDKWYRDGPKPLFVHLYIALSRYARGEIELFHVSNLLQGIRKYQSHPFQRKITPMQVVWHKKDVSLLYFPADNGQGKASVFIVPSLINKSYILDLLPERSFVRWLAQKGYNVYLLDWGNPSKNPDLSTMDQAVLDFIIPAMDFLFESILENYFLLGYCMGGTLVSAASCLNKDNLKGVIFLAAPWDFHAGDTSLSELASRGSSAAIDLITHQGVLSSGWIQSLFAQVDPDYSINKFSNFLLMDNNDNRAKFFVAVEDWLNDSLDLPGSIAYSCISEWYQESLPSRGRWKIGGHLILPDELDVPALVVASKKDRLVPKESSLSLANQLPVCKLIQPDIGHIGMMTGSRAEELVWAPIIDWIRKTL